VLVIASIKYSIHEINVHVLSILYSKLHQNQLHRSYDKTYHFTFYQDTQHRNYYKTKNTSMFHKVMVD